MLDLVPFAGARRVVRDNNFQSGPGGELCEFMFPEPGPVPVGSAAVGCDEDSLGVWIFLFAPVLPPFVDGSDGEDRGVMVDTHRDPGAVVGNVVDSVGDGLAVGLIGKVVGGHLDRFALWMPFLAGLRELTDQFFFLCIDADHGVAGGEELAGQLVEVAELVVPVWVLVSLQLLASPLQAVAQGTEEIRNGIVTDGVTQLRERGSEVTR